MSLPPGFADPVHDAQAAYRALLAALAEPWTPVAMPAKPPLLASLEPGCAAASLTLLDNETTLWLQPGIETAAREWLTFHTRCRFVVNPAEADFAIVADTLDAPPLSAFRAGTITQPHESATLFLQVANFEAGTPVQVRGPGIDRERTLAPHPLAEAFWKQWSENAATYPLGVDVFFFSGQHVVGLPRTTQLALAADR